MRALLDVNVLIALLDSAHASHAAAATWFSTRARAGWASCPITQNGCLRVMSQPRYLNRQPISVIAERLREGTAQPVHEFWADDVSLLDEQRIDSSRIHGAGQNTDTYLLALAVKHGGRLVTFDPAVTRSAVPGAASRHLVVLTQREEFRNFGDSALNEALGALSPNSVN